MDKITKKLMKYFLCIIFIVIFACFIASSIFISKSYINQEYLSLKKVAEEVYDNLKSGTTPQLVALSGVLVDNDSVIPIGHGKMMSIYKTIDFRTLKTKDSFSNPMGQKFISYRLSTDKGDIVIFKSGQDYSEYLKVVYITLILVFMLSILLSIPFILYLGKKFTNPIIKLQKASSDIAKDVFRGDINIKTGDEIEDLANSLKSMAHQLNKKHTMQKEFIANVSHDFKTPLSIIRNYSEANYDGLLDIEDSRKYSLEIIHEVDRLNNLVLDLLQLSKLQGDNIALNKIYFNLGEFLEPIINKFTSIALKKHISITINYEGSININHVEIQGDLDYIYRVMYNFIENAIKFSNTEGVIEVNVILNKDLKISVKDFGTGINEEMKNNIWDRYYKHSASGGLGLGLAICAEILKKHGFEYGVNSSQGLGSEFFFIIPYHNYKVKTID